MKKNKTLKLKCTHIFILFVVAFVLFKKSSKSRVIRPPIHKYNKCDHKKRDGIKNDTKY